MRVTPPIPESRKDLDEVENEDETRTPRKATLQEDPAVMSLSSPDGHDSAIAEESEEQQQVH